MWSFNDTKTDELHCKVLIVEETSTFHEIKKIIKHIFETSFFIKNNAQESYI